MKTYTIFAGLLLIAVSFFNAEIPTASAANNIDGTWRGVLGGETEDSQPMTLTFKFQQDGNILTGTVVGGPDEWIPIRDGVIKGNALSFQVDVVFQKTKMKFSYTGVIKDDEIEMTFTNEMEGWTGRSLPRSFVIKPVGR